MNKIQQTVKQSAQQVAVAAAKAAVYEKDKVVESVRTQVGIPGSEKAPGVDAFEDEMPSVVSEAKSSPQLDVDAIHAREKAMLADLEAQLARIRQQEAQKLQVYNQNVADELKATTEATQQQSQVEPQGKVRKAVGKVKKAVSQIMNRKQGETKQGSGKG